MPRPTKQVDKSKPFDLDASFFTTPWLRNLIYFQCDAKTISLLRNVCKSIREEVDKHTLQHRCILVPSEHVFRYGSYTNLAMQDLRHQPHHRYDSKGNALESTDDSRRLLARRRRLDLTFLQQARSVVITGGPGIVTHENHRVCRIKCKCGHQHNVFCLMQSLYPNLRRLVMTYGPIGSACRAWEEGISTEAWHVDWTSEYQLTGGTRRSDMKLSQWKLEYPCAFAIKADDPLSVIQDLRNARQLLCKARQAVDVKSQYMKTYQARRQSKPGKKFTRTHSNRELTRLRKEKKEVLNLHATMTKSVSLHKGKVSSARMQQFASALEEQLDNCMTQRWRYWLNTDQGDNPFPDLNARFHYQNIQVYYSAANLLKMIIEDTNECMSEAPSAYEYVEAEQRWRTKADNSVHATFEKQSATAT